MLHHWKTKLPNILYDNWNCEVVGSWADGYMFTCILHVLAIQKFSYCAWSIVKCSWFDVLNGMFSRYRWSRKEGVTPSSRIVIYEVGCGHGIDLEM